MFKIKNLTPYQLDDTNGKLNEFNIKDKITIKGKYFKLSEGSYIKIHSNKRIKETVYNYKVNDKYVYLIWKDNCTEETYVSLNFWQNIKFQINFLTIKSVIVKIRNFIKSIKELFLGIFLV